MKYKVSVPGKLYIAGEYAVVKGFHAIIIPTKLKVNVSIESSSEFKIKSNQWDTYNTYQLHHLKRSKALWKKALNSAYSYLQYKKIHIQPNKVIIHSELDQLDHKLGLGSSGAIVISLIKAALIFHQVDTTPRLLYMLGVNALKDDSETSSFGDLACSAYETPILYKKDITINYKQEFKNFMQLSWDNLVIQTIQLPLVMMVIHTNMSASSTKLVDLLSQNMSQKEQMKVFKQIDETVLKLVTAIKDQNLKEIFECIKTLESYMTKLDSYMSGHMYVTPIKTIFEIAKKHDIAYKISGAGGGDNVLLFLNEQKEYTNIKQSLPNEYLEITKFITGASYE